MDISHIALSVLAAVSVLAVIPLLAVLQRHLSPASRVPSWAGLAAASGTGALIAAASYPLLMLPPILIAPVTALGAAFAALATAFARTEERPLWSVVLVAAVATTLVYAPVVSLAFGTWFDPFGTATGYLDLGGALPTLVAGGCVALASEYCERLRLKADLRRSPLRQHSSHVQREHNPHEVRRGDVSRSDVRRGPARRGEQGLRVQSRGEQARGKLGRNGLSRSELGRSGQGRYGPSRTLTLHRPGSTSLNGAPQSDAAKMVGWLSVLWPGLLVMLAWVGWSAGLELAIDKHTATIVANTQIMAGVGALTASVIERLKYGTNTASSCVLGLIAGLAASTPASAFVTLPFAVAIAVLSAALCALLPKRGSQAIVATATVASALSCVLLGAFAENLSFVYTGQPELLEGQAAGAAAAALVGALIGAALWRLLRGVAVADTPIVMRSGARP